MYKASSGFGKKHSHKSGVKLAFTKPGKARVKNAKSLAHRLDEEAARANGAKLTLKTDVELKAPRIRATKVYLVKMTLKQKPDVSFLKVGITRNTVEHRFKDDMDKYDMEVIAVSGKIRRDRAFTFEQNILLAAKSVQYYPRVPLLSGNTECFKFSNENQQMLKILVENCTDPYFD